MGRIDPMYQFSLDAYISLFNLSIDKSHRSNKLEDRIDYLNEYHTYAVYRSEVPPLCPRQEATWQTLMPTLLATSTLVLSHASSGVPCFPPHTPSLGDSSIIMV